MFWPWIEVLTGENPFEGFESICAKKHHQSDGFQGVTETSRETFLVFRTTRIFRSCEYEWVQNQMFRSRKAPHLKPTYVVWTKNGKMFLTHPFALASFWSNKNKFTHDPRFPNGNIGKICGASKVGPRPRLHRRLRCGSPTSPPPSHTL